MDSPLPPLLQATSGAIGSAVGNAIVFPLDLATTRLQNAPKRSRAQRLSLFRTLYRLAQRKGVSHLYSGLPADTVSTLISSFLYFLFYTSLHKLLLKRNNRLLSFQAPVGETSSPAGIGGMTTKVSEKGRNSHPQVLGAMEELVIGVISGVLSKGVTLPISAVCVRQQLGSRPRSRTSLSPPSSAEPTSDPDSEDDIVQYKYRPPRHRRPLTLFQTLQIIHAESGLLGLYSALPPTIPLSLLPSLTLYIHTLLVRLLPSKLQSHPPGIVTFLLGALSNSLATIPMYPLVLAKSISQAGGGSKGKKNAGFFSDLRRIVEVDGVAGLYRGVQGQILKGLVQQGVMMLIKQRVEEAVVKVYRSRSRG